jgi:hypothetical protein
MSENQADGITVSRVVQFAAAAVPGAEHAAISTTRDGVAPETIAGTSQLSMDLDRLQFETGQGPAIQALVRSDLVWVDDFENDTQWPEFGRRAVAEAGIRSMASYRLFMSSEDRGSLNLYATKPGAFDQLSLGIGALFASYASLTLMNRLHRDKAMHLDRALESSREIGCALGILMARELLTQGQAFDLLRTASQHTHRKLRDIARVVTETGALPELGKS